MGGIVVDDELLQPTNMAANIPVRRSDENSDENRYFFINPDDFIFMSAIPLGATFPVCPGHIRNVAAVAG